MPSPVERALRGVALLALAGLTLRVVTAREGVASSQVTSVELPRALQQATLRPPTQLQLRASVLPAARERAWLRALARTGTEVRWSPSRGMSGTALTVEAVRAPGGQSFISMVGAADSAVRLSDASGLLGTLRPGERGAASMIVAADGSVASAFATGEAVAARRDSFVLRPVLLIGRAGWEAKFVAAALEEAGWQVQARLTVAPGIFVTQGAVGTPDTSRYAAVVMLDSARTPVDASLRAYVTSGGGLVVAHDAAERPELLQLAGVSTGVLLRGYLGALEGADPRAGLRAARLGVRGSGVPLDRRADAPTVVARRVGAGRVVISSYQDSWRWRMTGNESAPRDHREWWNRLVAAAAFACTTPLLQRDGFDEAPLAATVDAIGPALSPARGAGDPWPPWFDGALAAIAIAALALEWGLRRWRGAP